MPRVVLSAYAVIPGGTSEPGAGWAFARAAAENNEVWLLTSEHHRRELESELARAPVPSLHPVYVNAGGRPGRHAGRVEYVRWQRAAGRRAAELHRAVRFDVAHHVVLSSDWLPVGLSALTGVPLVWGPVGGVRAAPFALWRYLGVRGSAEEAARIAIATAGRALVGRRVARRASVVALQNPDALHHWGHCDRTVVESNAALDPLDLEALATSAGGGEQPTGSNRNGTRRAIYVGRVVPWKGLRLAIEALAQPAASAWTLDVYGDGSDVERCRRAAERLGLGERVHFHGSTARPTVLRAMTEADALLLPTMHDSGPWVVAEAVSLGCPVVALDRGGPRLLAADGGALVPADRRAPSRLAGALAALRARPPCSDRWSHRRLPEIVDRWYASAMQTAPGRSAGSDTPG